MFKPQLNCVFLKLSSFSMVGTQREAYILLIVAWIGQYVLRSNDLAKISTKTFPRMSTLSLLRKGTIMPPLTDRSFKQ